jgi:hypothetical protein
VTFTPAAPCLTSDIRHPTQIICLHAALNNDPAVALKAAAHALGVQPWVPAASRSQLATSQLRNPGRRTMNIAGDKLPPAGTRDRTCRLRAAVPCQTIRNWSDMDCRAIGLSAVLRGGRVS